ncbi:transcription antitermination factor NusB [Jannaschia sp. Os4]|uniref:transcription antitermination factor NusB n=1 Tax=Jannaschia sp. Os4 TaxID=2807617 RepID=UPI00193ACB4A|nr:transcription antitermination factor NusB [Jannaschia sp. Os4]MBM2577941.1 transcription antitermination factor NusB [Jannaschia sp. Os4]
MPNTNPDDARALRRRMRSAARLYAVQALYQMEAMGQSLDAVRVEFEDHRLGMEVDGVEFSEAHVDTFRAILEGAVSHQARIDQTTDRALADRWPIKRIDPVLRALFRAAGAEFVAKEAPPKVVIVEYVEVARAFFPEGKEAGFVNAVLDAMAREVQPGAFK